MPNPNQPQAERDFWLSNEEKKRRDEHDAKFDAKFKEIFNQLPEKRGTLFEKDPQP